MPEIASRPPIHVYSIQRANLRANGSPEQDKIR